MTILNEKDVLLLESLAISEAELINKAFAISEARGLLHFSNAITSFEEHFIKSKYGNIIKSFCSEYRTFIIKLLLHIDDKYNETVIGEILIPKVRAVNDEEMFKILEGEVNNENICRSRNS